MDKKCICKVFALDKSPAASSPCRKPRRIIAMQQGSLFVVTLRRRLCAGESFFSAHSGVRAQRGDKRREDSDDDLKDALDGSFG